MFLQEVTPSMSPWLDPKFLLPAGVIAIGFICWLVRGEFKSNANTTRQAEFEEVMDQRLGRIEANQERTKTALYDHAGNTRIHHNEEAFKEFREGLSQRFSTMDTKLSEIKNLIISNHQNR